MSIIWQNAVISRFPKFTSLLATLPVVNWLPISKNPQPLRVTVDLEFSFSLTGCLTKATKLRLSYYLLIAGEKIDKCLFKEE